MNTKKLVFLGTSLVVLAVVLFFAQSAMAGTTPPSNDGTCGKSGPFTGHGLIVKKTVDCEKDTKWTWEIIKKANVSELLLSVGQPFTVNYSVKASATESAENYKVSGRISVRNTTDQPIKIDVSDTLGDVICSKGLPYSLPGGNTLECTYSGSLKEAAAENQAIVYVEGQETPVVATALIDWSKATGGEIDECIDVTDNMVGPLGTVCAGDTKVFTFEYTREFKYDVCGKYEVENIASFVTTDTKTVGTSKWIIDVDVPCEGGCTLTPGYWKTHAIFGPAPYDSTWDAKDGGNAEFLGTGKSYYEVLWTDPKGGNAFFILAHAFIAAELNQLNGAHVPAEVASAMSDAQEMLVKYQDSMEIPKKSPDRATAIQLAGILDAYNNGLIGPGHCSE